MSKSAGPSPLGALLQELFRRKNWQQRLDQHALFLRWEEIVGTEIAERAQPDCIRGEVLWLRTTDSVWMQHLSLQKTTLLALLNGRLGENGVKDIRFRLDVGLSGRRQQEPGGERPGPELPISMEELEEFEQMALPLKDEELKGAMRRFWLKSRRRRG
jgi:predicted nucleic acid-binding Zn ribbon protein